MKKYYYLTPQTFKFFSIAFILLVYTTNSSFTFLTSPNTLNSERICYKADLADLNFNLSLPFSTTSLPTNNNFRIDSFGSSILENHKGYLSCNPDSRPLDLKGIKSFEIKYFSILVTPWRKLISIDYILNEECEMTIKLLSPKGKFKSVLQAKKEKPGKKYYHNFDLGKNFPNGNYIVNITNGKNSSNYKISFEN